MANNPFTDPRAKKLLSTQTAELSSLASQFNAVAQTAELAAGALRSANGESDWTGSAADAFRQQLGSLPSELDKVHQSYSGVSTALTTYGTALDPIQTKFKSLQSQYATAQSDLSTAHSTASTANAELTKAQNNPYLPGNSPLVGTGPLDGLGTFPTGASASGTTVNGVYYPKPVPPLLSPTQVLSSAQTAASQANSAVTRAQGTIDSLEKQGNNLLDEFDHVRGTAKSSVSAAKGVAPKQPSLGFWGSIGHFFGDVGSGAWGIIKDVGTAAYHLPGAAVNLLEHPLSADAWEEFGEDLGTVAGAVAMAAAILAFPADAIGLEGATALLDGTADAAGTLATVGTEAKTVGDTGKAIDGDGSWDQVLGDAEALGFGKLTSGADSTAEDAATDANNAKSGLEKVGLNRALGADGTDALDGLTTTERAGVETALKNDNQGIEQYSLNKALGANPDEAYGALTDAQKSQLDDAVNRLSDPKGLSEMRTTAGENAENAETHATNVGRTNHVLEWLNDQAKGQVVGPEPKAGS